MTAKSVKTRYQREAAVLRSELYRVDKAVASEKKKAERSEFELEQTLEAWRLAEKLNAVIRTVTFPKQLRALVIRTLNERHSTHHTDVPDDEQPDTPIAREE